MPRLERAALAFAAVTGVAMALGVQASPHGIRPIIDERYYVEWALSIARGKLVDDQPFWLDPLHAYVLGFVFFVTKGSLLAGRLFNVALGVGTVALVGATARTLWDRPRGAIAMWMLALYGPHTFMLGFLTKEALVVHLTAWAVLLAVRIQAPEAPARSWAGFGFVLGLLWIARGNFVPLVPIAFAWAAFSLRQPKRLPLLGLCILLPLSLASAHNLAAGGSWRPLTPLAGPNFYYGSHVGATGAFDKLDFVRANTRVEKTDFLAEAERRTGRTLSMQEMSDYWFREGLSFWREHPGDALALQVKKVWLLVHEYEIPDMYPQTFVRRWFCPVLWLLPLGFGYLLGLALIGAWKTERRGWPLIALALLYGGSVAIFFIFDRYRIPLAVPLCLLAANGAWWLWDRRLPWRAFAVVAAATLLAVIPTSASRESDAHDAYTARQLGLLLESDGLHEEAQPWLERGGQ